MIDVSRSYGFASIERKWQKRWEHAGCFRSDRPASGAKFFNFDGGPFPNGPLHMGHVRTFTLGDVMARYQRMRGRRVLYSFEFDAFGLPNELAAESEGTLPEVVTRRNIERMRRQMVRLGLSYDWDYVHTTCDPKYYRWTQWLFLKLYERGLIYRGDADLNWCPRCRTTLAHLQVEEGRCWRCETPVETRRLTQWFVRLSAHSRQLRQGLDELKGLGTRVRRILVGFLGETRGVELDFRVVQTRDVLTAFVPKGQDPSQATYIAVSRSHPVLTERRGDAQASAQPPPATRTRAGRRRTHGGADLTGEATGLSVLHPRTRDELPIYVADYVDPSFATGVEIGSPASSPRDQAFARLHGIPEKRQADAGDATMGRSSTHYRVRDWLVSRQRAWGTPIPVIYCGRCGTVPVPEEDLPVRLPALSAGDLRSGLLSLPQFAESRCPRCHGDASRETDTLDCYFDVVWCFLACATRLENPFAFRADDFAAWTPVDWFHNGLDSFFYVHLYRFIARVLYEMDVLEDPEPIRNYRGHDAVLLGGRKMSKHHVNVVSPDGILGQVGADALRVHVLWAANPAKSIEWSEVELMRATSLLGDVWRLVTSLANRVPQRPRNIECRIPSRGRALKRTVDHAIRRVTALLERYQFAGCLQEIHRLHRRLERASGDPSADPEFERGVRTLILLLAPFAPHLAEEMWERIGGQGFVATSPWPESTRQPQEAHRPPAQLEPPP